MYRVQVFFKVRLVPANMKQLNIGRGMIRSETLIELKFLNSSFSSCLSDWRYTNDSLSNNSSPRYLNQQYHPPLLQYHS